MNYRREVVRVKDITGPRGGTVLVCWLSCGHWIWFRGRRVPPLRTDCTACFLADHPEIFEDEGK